MQYELRDLVGDFGKLSGARNGTLKIGMVNEPFRFVRRDDL